LLERNLEEEEEMIILMVRFVSQLNHLLLNRGLNYGDIIGTNKYFQN